MLINLFPETRGSKDIRTFNLRESENAALSIDITGTVNTSTVEITVPNGTDITALIVDLTISGTSVVPADGDIVDFSGGPETFIVTDKNGKTKDYTVTVTASSDITPPDITLVTISSNNANSSLANPGDVITLSFVSDEDIQTPTVSILGNSVSASGGPTSWTATYTAQIGDTPGVVAFSISEIKDLIGNPASDVGSVTDGSSVTFVDVVPTVSINDVSVAENAGTAQFTVTLSSASSQTVTVNYATANGTAAAGTEYTSASNTLTFIPGTTTQNISVPIADDSTDEKDKTYNVNLSGAVNASITGSTGLGTITDDDAEPSLSINDVSVAEAAGNAQFTVTLSPASAKTVTVNYATADGTAVAGTEYTSTSNTLTFIPGTTTQNIIVPIADDTTDEEDKTYNVNLSVAVNASITGSTGLGTITDDDAEPSLSINDVSVAEAAGNAQFTVTLSPASAKTVTVNYATADGTAAAGTEYTSSSNTLTFIPGTTTQNINVPIADDSTDEEDKTYNVNLSGAVNASITGSTGLGTITDDDAEPSLSINDVSVAEAAGNAQFTVTLSPASAKTVTVNYATADGTAVAGTEYTSASNTLTFTPGITTQNISVTIADDSTNEEDKTYNVNLSVAVNASITGSTGLGTITDDDAEPSLSINDVSVAEAAGNAQFTVTLSPASAKTVTVNYATADGTAAAGTEFTGITSTPLTFNPGTTTQNINVTITDDAIDEEDKTYNVNLSGAVNASITDSTGLGTITDDDAEPSLSINDVSVDEDAVTAQFTVTLSPASEKTVTVNYATADGTAVAGTEYTTASNTLTFIPGITTQNINVTIADDAIDEEDKTYNVNLSGAVNASITGATGLGTITDDDAEPSLSINDVSVEEDVVTAQFTVTLSPASEKTVTVNYATADGTAVAGTEYTAASNTLTFTPGITTRNINVTIADDTTDEEDKTYNVNLSGAVNASITGATGLGTITDDDAEPSLSINDVSVDEDAVTAQFTVTLFPASSQTVTVNYATADGTAIAGTEYTTASNTLTFIPGITTQNINVTIADDAIDEEDKTYNVNLSSAVNATITGSTGLGTITDDDDPPSLSINDVSVEEDAVTAQFTVTLSSASSQTVTVNYATADGTAVAGTEYTTASNTLTFIPGITTQNINVTIADDAIDEEDKTYNVNLSGAVNASITGATGLGTITDDDDPPSLSINDVSVEEDAVTAQFTVTLSSASSQTVTVNYATADGTAVAGTEYTTASNTLTFIPGITTQNINVTIADDAIDEEDKTYNVNLSGAVNASITGATGLGTITDDDAEPSLSINDVSVEEDVVTAQFTVTLSPASEKTVTVNYATADGTAVAGTEYTAASNTLTFTPGITTRNINVTIADDTTDEEDKTYNVNLSGAVNASITDSTGLGTITDDDAEPSLSINDVSVEEDVVTAQFTVTLSPASEKTVTVNYATADSTAVAGTEYTAASNTLTFTPGITTRNINVTIADDTTDEEDKTYNVNLSGAVNASITGSTGLGTITDDDAEPSLSINDVSVDEDAVTAQFTVTLSPASEKTVTVNYATADGTAAAGTEYTAASNTLTFTPGITTRNINVTIADDTTDEEDKTYNVNLSGAVNGSITGSTGLGTITDDDDPPSLSINDVSVDEDAVTAQFTVTLSPASAQTVTVNYATADGTAVAGTEFTGIPSTPLTFNPGTTTRNINVTIADDSVDEEDKTYNVNLSSAVNASITGLTGLGTIIDDDDPPSLSINDVSVDEDAVTAQFTVTLSPASEKTVTVNYATADGTAVAGTEFTGIPSTPLTFNPGTTTRNINVTIADDSVDEEDKTYNVNLSSAVNASITGLTGLGTIIDDDDPPSLSINDVSVDEDAVTAQFTVTLSPASGKTVTVNYATADDTAIAVNDYTNIGSTPLTFSPGTTTQNINVTINNDTTDENNETYNVNLSGAVNATITGSTGLGTITDNDDPPSLSIDDVSVAENAGTAQFTVTLSPASAKTVTVNHATADDTAVAGTEFTGITSTPLTFNPGITTQNINVTITDDTTDEEDKTYNVNLSGAANASITGSSGLGTITDNDNPPDIKFNSTASTTGDETATLRSFDVVLAAVSEKTITVKVTDTEGGSAVSGTDYNLTIASPETVTFNPGDTTKSVSFTPIDDTIDEDTGETISFNLSNALNANLVAPTAHTVTITDDDNTPIVNFSSSTGNGDENVSPVDIAVTLSNATILTVVVDFTVAAGTADDSGTDFTLANGQVTIGAGTTSANISFTVNSDLLDEDNEDFQVTLTNVSSLNATLGSTLTHTYTIDDDDDTPSLSIDNISAGESTGTAQFTVTLSAESGKTVTVSHETADITASAGNDYTGITSTVLTFNPGDTTKTIDVSILPDTTDEIDETYNVNLSGAVNASITGSTGLGTITDDDDLASLSINDVSADEDTGTAQFTVTLSPASGKTVAVEYVSSGDTATAGNDYTEVGPSTLTFSPGVTTKTIDVTISSDTTDEDNETYDITLSSESNATLGDPVGVGTITNDDNPPDISFSSAASSTANENALLKTFNVVLSEASGKTITVQVTDNGTGTADSGVDYNLTNASPETLTFNSGDTTKSVSFTPIVDTIDEDTGETIIFSLSGASNATLTAPTGHTATITDDDGTPTVNFSSSTGNGAESILSVDIPVVLSNATILDVDVSYIVTAGTAEGGGTDFALASGSVTITALSTSANINFTVNNDLLDEIDEDFQVTLDSVTSTNADLGTTLTHTYTINDNDDPPSLSINNISVAENAGPAQFTVTLSAESGKTVSVDYDSEDDTAVSGSDYTGVSSTLIFNPGVTTQGITVAITDESTDENDETYNVNLTAPVNATIGTGTGVGTITNDDTIPSLSIDDVSVSEDAGPALFTVTLSEVSGKTVSVIYSSSNVTAIAGSDYTAVGSTLTFSPGVTTQGISVTISDESTDENDETYDIILASPTNATIGTGTGVGTITNDDTAPSLSINDVSVNESAGTAQFTVTLSPASGKTVSVNYATSDVDTTADTDYTAIASTPMTFSPGETAQTIDVSITQDSDEESDETYNVNLSGPSNATISDDTGLGTIVDDDTASSAPWPKRIGGVDAVTADSGGAITTDGSGNVFITGFVTGDADLNNDQEFTETGENDYSDPQIYGGKDIILAKYAPDGSLEWSYRLGGTGEDEGLSIITDSSGNVIVTGFVTGDADLDGDAQITAINGENAGAGGKDVFISKFDADGTFGWSERITGPADDTGNCVTIDSADDSVVVAGLTYGTPEIISNGITAPPFGTNAETDMFVVKFDADGTFSGYSMRLGGAANELTPAVGVDGSQNIVVVFTTNGDIDLNLDGDAKNNVTPEKPDAIFGSDDIIFAKYDPTMSSYTWGKRMGGSGNDHGQSIVIDGSDNIIITGYVTGNADLAGDEAISGTGGETVASGVNGAEDIFMSKFNSSGSLTWSMRLGGTGFDEGKDIILDSAGDILLTGYVSGDADLTANELIDGDNGEDSSYGGKDIFISKFTTAGSSSWAKRLGGSGDDEGHGVASDSSNNVIFTGFIYQTGDLNGDGDSFDDAEDNTNYDYNDIFVSLLPSTGIDTTTLNDIITFKFLQSESANNTAGISTDVIGTVNANTVELEVPNGTDVTGLIPEITINGASVDPASGVPQNFSSSVPYTVTAENSSEKVYTVTVNLLKEISTFEFLAGENGDLSETVVGDINHDAGTITVTVPEDTIVTNLRPNIEIIGDSVSPDDSVEMDFTNPVVYTVTASDSSEKPYTVTVTKGIPTKTVNPYTTGDGNPTFNMVYVEEGLTFKQGVDDLGDVLYYDGNADPTATVENAFEIGQTEVTYELWYAVRDWAVNGTGATGAGQYVFINEGLEGNDWNDGNNDGLPPTEAKLEPVTDINWRDAIVWCNALTEYYNAMEGQSLDCVYTSDAGFSTPLRDLTETNTESYFLNSGELDNPYVNPNAKGFRLPTTTEWSAAARWEGDTKRSVDAYELPAGQWWTAGDYASGAVDGDYLTDANNDPYAWYDYNDEGELTHNVGAKTANKLGLYDMSGNVYEFNFGWCPNSIGNYRVKRGGSWGIPSDVLQVGYWDQVYPWLMNYYHGMRICRTYSDLTASNKNITEFKFLASESANVTAGISTDVTGTIDGTNITLIVPEGTTVTGLIPEITINGSSVDPDDGVAQDFSSQVVYTVTATDSSTKEYTVTVTNCTGTGCVTTYTTGGGPTFNMVTVEAGLEFKQGVNDDGVGASSATATVDNTFEIGQTEVTYELWYAVRDWAETGTGATGAGQYVFINKGIEGHGGGDGVAPGARKLEPVMEVNWRDTIVWCNALTEYYNAIESQSLDCVYTSDAGYSSPLRDLTDTNSSSYFLNPGELDDPYVNPNAKGFRLPTTTEWGAAARWEGDTQRSVDADELPAGQWWTDGKYASGAVDGNYNTDDNNNPYAWYSFNAEITTHNVGDKTANELGLYDMSGNVWEWNFDWHPDSSGDRVIRGGSYIYNSTFLQVGYWLYDYPYYMEDAYGFRFVRTQ